MAPSSPTPSTESLTVRKDRPARIAEGLCDKAGHGAPAVAPVGAMPLHVQRLPGFSCGSRALPQGACERRIHASRRLMRHVERDDDGSLRSEPHEEIGNDLIGQDGAHNPRGVWRPQQPGCPAPGAADAGKSELPLLMVRDLLRHAALRGLGNSREPSLWARSRLSWRLFLHSWIPTQDIVARKIPQATVSDVSH